MRKLSYALHDKGETELNTISKPMLESYSMAKINQRKASLTTTIKLDMESS